MVRTIENGHCHLIWILLYYVESSAVLETVYL